MKAYITVTDNDGLALEGEVELVASARVLTTRTQARRTSEPRGTTSTQPSDIDLSLPIRAFVKKYAGGMRGPQKFTLVLAHIAGGDASKKIPRADVEKQWKKMSGLLRGSFNPAYTTRAKDEGWVDSSGKGAYTLLTNWRGIFKNV